MTKKKTRIKAAAGARKPQTREQVISDIKELGDTQREITRLETRINDERARLTHQHSSYIDKAKLVAQINGLRDIAQQERKDALSKVNGLEWMVFAMMAYEDGVISADNVLEMVRRHFNLPTSISPATSQLGQLNHRLYTEHVRDTASASEVGD
ncbi:hypothetical protein [Arsenophonus sp. ENCA]|uniref:hypothetical protein n=1 Tax=Arsenophonus sp. ENCA TaxID=1987579 RepID=UPI0025BD3E58|nr:hypothetical protein [Arsenophonus sp. ENCA]